MTCQWRYKSHDINGVNGVLKWELLSDKDPYDIHHQIHHQIWLKPTEIICQWWYKSIHLDIIGIYEWDIMGTSYEFAQKSGPFLPTMSFRYTNIREMQLLCNQQHENKVVWKSGILPENGIPLTGTMMLNYGVCLSRMVCKAKQWPMSLGFRSQFLALLSWR
jgi:hypothetical protein